MSTGVDLLPKSADIEMWTAEEKSVADFVGFTTKIDNQIVVAPLGVRAAFLAAVELTGLNPVTRQIYLMYVGGKWLIYVSIDGLRIVAQRSGRYLGQTKQQWTDGVERPVPMVVNGVLVTDSEGNPIMETGIRWVDVWTRPEPPAAARVGVIIEGAAEPTYAIATWKQYAKMNRKGEPIGQWGDGGPHMLSKCAEALALRKAFPQDLSNIFIPEEISTDEAESLGRDWLADLEETKTSDDVLALYEELKQSGEWNKKLDAEFRAHLSRFRAAEQDAAETVVVEEAHA